MIDRFGDNLIKIIQSWRANLRFEKIYGFFIGDLLDGKGIYPGQSNYIEEQEILDTVWHAEEILEMFFLKLVSTLKLPLEIVAVSGNHSRFDRFAHAADNWERLLWHDLVDNLNGKNGITINYSTDFYNKAIIYNKKHIIMHGDGIRIWCGVPFTGIKRALLDWYSYDKDIGHFDYFHLGHLHVTGHSRINEMTYYLNGCSPYGDEWAKKNIKEKAANIWNAFIISDDGNISLIPINLY